MNCMVNRNWRVRVADFAMSGRAHIEEDEDGDGVTSQDPTSETQAAYMCPEMLRVATAKSSRHLGALHCTGRCYGQPFLCLTVVLPRPHYWVPQLRAARWAA